MNSVTASGHASEWTARLGRWIDAAPTVAPTGDIFVGSTQHLVTCLDPATGSARWRSEVGDQLAAPRFLGTDRLLVRSHGIAGSVQHPGDPLPEVVDLDEAIMLDARDGHESWRVRLGQYGDTWPSPDGVLYASLQNGFAALDPATGAARWTQPIDDIYNFRPIIGNDGALYHVERMHGDGNWRRIACKWQKTERK